MKFVKLFLLAAIILGVAFKMHHLSTIKFDPDVLDEQLQPAKQQLPLNSKIGFYDVTKGYMLYTITQYLLAPRVVLNQTSADTVLLVSFDKKIPPNLAAFQIISQSQTAGKTISILKKNR